MKQKNKKRNQKTNRPVVGTIPKREIGGSNPPQSKNYLAPIGSIQRDNGDIENTSKKLFDPKGGNTPHLGSKNNGKKNSKSGKKCPQQVSATKQELSETSKKFLEASITLNRIQWTKKELANALNTTEDNIRKRQKLVESEGIAAYEIKGKGGYRTTIIHINKIALKTYKSLYYGLAADSVRNKGDMSQRVSATNANKIRAHNLFFKIPYTATTSEDEKRLTEFFKIELNNNPLHRNRAIIIKTLSALHIRLTNDFYGETSIDASISALSYLEKVLEKLSEEFYKKRIFLRFSTPVSIVQQHHAWIGKLPSIISGFFKDYEITGKVVICRTEKGEERLIIDYSKGDPELEAIRQEFANEDIDNLKKGITSITKGEPTQPTIDALNLQENHIIEAFKLQEERFNYKIDKILDLFLEIPKIVAMAQPAPPGYHWTKTGEIEKNPEISQPKPSIAYAKNDPAYH